MSQLLKLLRAAILAGLAAGLLSAVLIEFRLAPLIVEAETHEAAAPHDHAATEDHDHAEAPAPEGLTRVALTTLSTVLAVAGFGLLLGGVAHLANLAVTVKNGWLWGLGTFWAVHAAPALILSPELPGMVSTDVSGRQVLWVLTAIAAGTGLLVIQKARNWPARGVGAVLALAPLFFPVLRAEGQGSVPPELASAFAANSLGIGALTFIVLGTIYALALERGPK